MLQLLSLAHGFAAPQPFSGPFWNLASQATGPWDQYWWLCKPRHSPATSRRPARPRVSACNTYMTVPDAPVDADVIVSRKNPSATVDDANHNCGVGDEAAFDSPNWAAACTFVPDWQWAAIYRSGGNWSGGQALQYVGYSETADGDASAVGACEEWWFAEGLGVVAIAKFPMLTYAGCRAVLAGTAPRGRPDSPDAQFAAYGDQMAGMAVLVDSCADDPTQCEACAWPGGGRGAGGECIGRK